ARRSAREGERKEVTVLVADIAGSLAMAHRIDPEDLHALMDGLFALALDAVHAEHGTINQFRGDGIKSSSSPLARLFAKTASRQSPVGSDGADTDWWLGLSGITENGGDVLGKRAAIMFFTDGACSAGEFGQVETARDDVRYQMDMARLAERFGEYWRGAALDAAGRESVLQLFCLPGAQGQGLDELLKTVPQARLDDWTTRFKK
ncbi:MAG: hypothetical protein HUU03_11320, partial [Planctomycetaceae bacterium]|nr:hypothetical protein [Planctomycetaceae bacterium]